jgi:DNA-binding beta-propeller fold protein YncE
MRLDTPSRTGETGRGETPGRPAAAYELVEGWAVPPVGRLHGRVADVAVDSADRVYVLDREPGRVYVHEPDGALVSSWAHPLLGPGCHGIAVDDALDVFVVDWMAHFVAKFSNDGRLQFVLGTPGRGADNGREPWPPRTLSYPVEWFQGLRATGPFNGCTQVAFGPDGDLFVSDGYGNARIHRFAPAGQLIASWGGPGTGPGEFHNPHHVWIGQDHLMYVSDRENDRVQVLTLDFEFVRAVEVQRPAAVAIDAQGRMAVASLRYTVGEDTFMRGRITQHVPDRLTVFGAEGEKLLEGDGWLNIPNGVAVDSHGDIYVAQVGQFHVINPGREPSSDGPQASESSAIAKFRRLA